MGVDQRCSSQQTGDALNMNVIESRTRQTLAYIFDGATIFPFVLQFPTASSRISWMRAMRSTRL